MYDLYDLTNYTHFELNDIKLVESYSAKQKQTEIFSWEICPNTKLVEFLKIKPDHLNKNP